MPRKLIGLTLSGCVIDMVNGLVDYEEVEEIYTNVIAKNKSQFEEIIEKYKSLYWRGFEEEAEEVALALWDGEKIVQPRTMKGRGSSVMDGNWEEI